MDSDEDFGDLDDTAFLEAATQFDNTNTTSFQGSARASKRRKINHSDERTASIPPRKKTQNHRRGPFIQSDDDDASSLSSVSRSASPIKKRRSARKSASPTKQRRRAQSKEKEYGDSEGDGEHVSNYTKKKKDRIYTPKTNGGLTDVFFTQPPREHSPPWKTRGAIWQKPAISIGVHRPSDLLRTVDGAAPRKARTIAVSERQSTVIALVSQQSEAPEEPISPISIEESPKLPTANPTAPEFDLTQELADLPSDAFASSSSSPQKQDNEIFLVSERRTRIIAPQAGLRQTTLFGREGVNGQIPSSQVNKRYNFVAELREEPPTHHKLDLDAIKTWVYPTNLGTIRDYQFNIVARGLYHNLLVALPTGLGKTFIAATIMLNWYRWTTNAQIVFVAPTKPLVAQQVQACFNIAGIPRSQTTMLIGGVHRDIRAEEWANKRVFFMTPQTFLLDLKAGIADPKKVVLLVVDEAHKATGSYAYVEVVSLLRRFNSSYRILALTATPGSDVESVQKVIDGLNISRIEIRTENSLDIRNFVHQRQVEKHVFTYNDEMEMCMDLYSKALQPCVSKIAGLNAFWSKNPLDLTPFGCTQACRKWFADVGRNAPQGQKSMVSSIFTILGSLSHGMELLKYHGIGPFYTKMRDFRDAQSQSKSKYKKEICESEAFKKLMVRLQAWVTSDTFVGHPKLDFLQEVVLDHFVNAQERRNADVAIASQTRIMVFAHFRDSAEDIVRVLKRHQPMIKPRVFVGQSGAKNSDGMNQKEQLNVIEQFKQGTYNTLVATSIGEEGLDIGEVDLIVCYDSKASPIRMLQRMGRTGRKREGKIILLQMEGKEVNDADKAKDNYEKMQDLIAEGSKFTFHDDVSRRILPRNVQPVVERRNVEIPLENSQTDFLPEPRKKRRATKRAPKKFHMPDGVITGFLSAGQMDQESAPNARGRKKAVPVYPSEQPALLPTLGSVLLDDQRTKDLERKYQTVFEDDDAPVIGALNLGQDIARQHVSSRTKNFPKPGRVAQNLVDTLRRMHAVDHKRLVEFSSNLHYSDCESDSSNDVVVPDTLRINEGRVADGDIWASDDPASQPIPDPKPKPGPKPKSKATAPRGKPAPKVNAPRGRPHKSTSASTTPVRQLASHVKRKTESYRASDLVEEGASSSPPPTDPRMRLASQAIDLGSDDTIGEEHIEDTQAYLLDSDLRDFIADDDEDVDVPDSSLPSINFGNVGRSTQAIVEDSRPKRPKKAEKIFTSDPTDDDAIVSSDSDDDISTRNGVVVEVGNKVAYVVDSPSDDEDEDEDEEISEEPIVRPKKRLRRVIDDDEDDE